MTKIKRLVLLITLVIGILSVPSLVKAQGSIGMCCQEGFNDSGWACPVGTDRNTNCCKRNGWRDYDITPKVECASLDNTLCCLSGFTDEMSKCPFNMDTTTQCCKRYGFASYQVIDKVECGTIVTGNYCCPEGFTDKQGSCPFGTDESTTCCRRNGWANYTTISKISCDLLASDDQIYRGQYALCAQVANAEDFDQCQICHEKEALWTAIGCIPSKPESIIGTLLKIGLSIAGGVALLMIMSAGFMFSVSQGDPKKTSEAKDLLSSAVIGLLFIIFSITILQFITVSVFRIPGFGG